VEISRQAFTNPEELALDITATQGGFVEVYVYNSSASPVWYDQFSISSSQAVIIQENHYYPFGMQIAGLELDLDSKNRYKFNGKELQDDHDLDWHDYGARMYDAQIGRWHVVDPMADERNWLSPYNYVQNNPMMRVDPTGALDEPVYDSNGRYRGDTKEGFTGEVIIYDGKEDFSKISKGELLSKKGAYTYDNQRESLSGDAKSNIWTHIASQLEGQQIYDENFSMSSLSDGKISFSSTDPGWWNARIKSKTITGTDNYSYETTVENIQSSIVVHEWYSHIQKGNSDRLDSHRLAYKNVINYKSLWNNTTDAYKRFNVRMLQYYTKTETGRTNVDPPYLNLYNKYKNKK